MYAKQLEAYKNVQKTIMSDREIVAAVLTKAALMLKKYHDNWDADDRDVKLDEAIRFNQLLWSILQAELMNSKNRLPKELKQNLLSLGVFVDKRTFEIMAFPSPEKLTILININLNIAAGLRGNP